MTRSDRLDLLDPLDVSRLGGIEVITEGVVEGFLTGLHRSPRRGFSVEFAEHRMYQPGDELRYVDWKILGRNDRLYVKQFEEETNLRAMVVCDISRSMAWTGDPETVLPKLAYAQRLVAALALVLLRQRDATGLIAFDDEVRAVLPPRARLSHWRQLVQVLGGLEAGQGTAAEPALRRVVDLLRRRGLVVFVSDLLLDRDLALKALRFLRHRGHQVLVLHVMDPGELTLGGPGRGAVRGPGDARRGRAAPARLGRRVQRHRAERGGGVAARLPPPRHPLPPASPPTRRTGRSFARPWRPTPAPDDRLSPPLGAGGTRRRRHPRPAPSPGPPRAADRRLPRGALPHHHHPGASAPAQAPEPAAPAAAHAARRRASCSRPPGRRLRCAACRATRRARWW